MPIPMGLRIYCNIVLIVFCGSPAISCLYHSFFYEDQTHREKCLSSFNTFFIEPFICYSVARDLLMTPLIRGIYFVLFALWTILQVRIILLEKAVSGKTWGEVMPIITTRDFVDLFFILKRISLWIKKEKIKYLYSLWRKILCLVLVIAGVAALICLPMNRIVRMFLMIVMVSICFSSYGWMSSCGHLLLAYIGQAALIGIGLLLAIYGEMPGPMAGWIAKDPAPYIIFCVSLIVFWSVSAGVADYDAAKMAGSIVNTFTTIALLGVNVLFWWTQRAGYVKTDVDAWIYYADVILFPMVAAGYLSTLCVELLQYSRKQLGLPDDEGSRGAQPPVQESLDGETGGEGPQE